jgi:DMSO/TMAO reductase YedYZ heme-binding membrane subunit
MSFKPKHKLSDLMLRLWPLLPLIPLAYAAAHGKLMAYADDTLGYDAVLALVACLAVTPVITAVKMPIAKLRWWYGNWVFFLGATGLVLHLAYPPGTLAARAAGNSVDWTGTLIIALLLPMTATSSVIAQKLLGPEWKRWQRGLVWVVWAVIALHLYLMHAPVTLAAYFAATLPAIVIRQSSIRKSVKDWRADHYENGHWWVVMGTLATLAIAGVTVLMSEEIRVAIHAVLLT